MEKDLTEAYTEWNAKTGVSRDVVAPVAMQFERLKSNYKNLA